VAKNTADALKDSQVYITLESMTKRLRAHFCIGQGRLDFMAARFFMVMADNMSAKRIYFKDFVEWIMGSLLSKSVDDQNRWAF
jgi:hypothetical protein